VVEKPLISRGLGLTRYRCDYPDERLRCRYIAAATCVVRDELELAFQSCNVKHTHPRAGRVIDLGRFRGLAGLGASDRGRISVSPEIVGEARSSLRISAMITFGAKPWRTK